MTENKIDMIVNFVTISYILCQLMRLIRGVRLLPFREYWNRNVPSRDLKYGVLDSLDSFSSLFDEEKRRTFAEEYLKRRQKLIEAQKDLYGQNLQQWVNNKKATFFKNVKNNYELVVSRLENRENSYRAAQQYFKDFAAIECKLVSLKTLAQFNGELPIIDESQELGHGTHFVVHPGEWSTRKNLAVKKLKPSSIESHSHLQY